MIANPAAGGGRGMRVAERGVAALQQAGQNVDLRPTDRPGQAAELAREALRQGAERLIVCGGDGTLRELLPALAGSGCPLGLLPFGTANDLARGLGIPRRFKEAISVLLEGQVQTIDLGSLNDRPFCTVATCGFDAEVNHAVSTRQVPFSGTPGYLWAALRRFSGYAPPPVHLRGEFGEYRGCPLLVATGNTSSYGGGMKIAPLADPGDGALDVCIVERVSTPTLLRVLPRIFWGGHTTHPAVRVERTTWLDIETEQPQILYADGDFAGTTPARIRVLPAVLDVVLPPPET